MPTVMKKPARWRSGKSVSVDLWFISQVNLYQKTIFTASPFGAQHIGIVWRTSRKACLLCPWARHLAGCLYLNVADR